MPRVKTRKASKDYPDQGIKKGDTYYSWAHYRGPKQRSKTIPTRSQLAGSEFFQSYYAFVDQDLPAIDNADDLKGLASSIRELAEEHESSKDNLPESFQNGEPGQKIDDRVSELQSWADELDGIADDLGEESAYDPDENGGLDWGDFVASKIEEATSSAPDPE